MFLKYQLLHSTSVIFLILYREFAYGLARSCCILLSKKKLHSKACHYKYLFTNIFFILLLQEQAQRPMPGACCVNFSANLANLKICWQISFLLYLHSTVPEASGGKCPRTSRPKGPYNTKFLKVSGPHKVNQQ